MKRLLPVILYVLFLIFAFFYIREVLSTNDIEASEKDKKSVVKEEKVNVTLKVELPGKTETYEATMVNTDSVTGLLDKITEKNAFNYERTVYVDRVLISEVNGIKPAGTQVWKIYDGETNITDVMDDTRLKNKKVYILKLLES